MTPVVPDPQKVELARQILAADGFEQLARQVESQTLTRTIAVMGQNPMFPRAFLQELSKQMAARVPDLDLKDSIVALYQQRFTTDELRQILAFESSPVGQKLMSSGPAMLAQIQPEVTLWNRKTSQEVTRKILTEHPDWGKQIAENRQRENAEMLATTMPSADAAGKSSEKTYWNTRDVQPPQVIAKAEPQYSEEARKAKLEGSVMLSLTVGSDGAAHDVKVVRPLGSGLDEKAVQAVNQWRWRPAMKSGVAVATRATVEVRFQLQDNPPTKN